MDEAGTYFDRYISGYGPYGKRTRLDVDVTKVDLEDRDRNYEVLYLERLAELG